MAKIRGFLVDVENNICEPREVEDELDVYYDLLNCSCIELPQRYIGDRAFTIICDEEGTFKDPVIVSAINSKCSCMLVGNLFITGLPDDTGELTSISDDDVNYIERHIKIMIARTAHYVLTQCEYRKEG